LGVITQFGGQTPLKIAKKLHKENIPILGTPYLSVDTTEDREKFKTVVSKLSLKQPKNGICFSVKVRY